MIFMDLSNVFHAVFLTSSTSRQNPQDLEESNDHRLRDWSEDLEIWGTWISALVVDLPLWTIWVRQLGWWHSQLIWKVIKKYKTCSKLKPPISIWICGDYLAYKPDYLFIVTTLLNLSYHVVGELLVVPLFPILEIIGNMDTPSSLSPS